MDPFGTPLVKYDITDGIAEPVDNKTGVIVFDTETTGVNADEDEVLQISVIDGAYNTLLDQYVRPLYIKEWPQAQKIHGISPEMVKGKPTAQEMAPVVRAVFQSARIWIAYNGTFDLRFLKKWGIEPDAETQVIDVMKDFAPIYGERGKYGTFKWQKLTVAAEYYGYTESEVAKNMPLSAHNSLADVYMTLYVHKEIEKAGGFCNGL